MGEGTTTKRPIRRRRIIERPRLTRLLDESQARIKMLVAPAGYGKTTLARQWLEKRAAWYVGGASSIDVAALAAGVANAVSAVVPSAGTALVERLSVTPSASSEPDVLAGMLAADLSEWPQQAWFVFDDYHALVGVPAAERFVESLLLGAPLNVLVISRRRPRWATARRILYGDIFELDRSSLAMTEREAAELLNDDDIGAADLNRIAQGWPAVLGLARLAGASLPEVSSTPHLHDFLAGELYQRLSSDDRRHLCELSLYDSESLGLGLGTLPICDPDRLLRVGIESGFLNDTDGVLDIHPLLRSFLSSKVRREFTSDTAAVIARVTRALVSGGFWDEAFDVIDHFGEQSLVTELLESSLGQLLASGRTATVRRWIDSAPEQTPTIMFAAAELAFREGHFHESEALATISARDSSDSAFAAQALLVAGRAAHAASRAPEAADLYAKAGEIAVSEEQKRLAMLGALGAAIELERSDARELLESLGSAGDLDPGERVILVSRRINLETRFSLRISLEEARAMWQLLPRVADPMLRASFLNVFGYALAAMGHTTEALALTAELLEEADRYRLDFVIPYALTNQALVQMCQHQYQGATETLDEAEDRALAAGDQTAYYIAWCVRTRLTNAQAAFERSLSRAIPRNCDQTQSLEAELLASYAVALAATGDLERARDYARRASRMSRAVETAISAPAALAVVSLSDGESDQALAHARDALDVAARSGMIESFVSAYRGCPEILICLLADTSCHDDLTRVVMTAGDAAMMSANREGRRSILDLSPREKEVLALVAQGCSNPEIGRRLFISPVTVKVHVRHIFEKLGVSSRAEAALRAAQLGRGQAAPAETSSAEKGLWPEKSKSDRRPVE